MISADHVCRFGMLGRTTTKRSNICINKTVFWLVKQKCDLKTKTKKKYMEKIDPNNLDSYSEEISSSLQFVIMKMIFLKLQLLTLFFT